MVDHPVGRPDSTRPGIILAAALAACLAWAAVTWAFSPMVVLVDGTLRTVASGSTLAQLSERRWLSSPAGDAIGVAGGVVAVGRGGPPRVQVDGSPGTPGTRLGWGSVVVSSRGADITEPAVSVLEALAPPIEDVGVGPDVSMRNLGVAGLARITRGRFSRSVVSSTTVMPAEPLLRVHAPFPPGTPLVALTFDDGPWPGSTGRVLDILRAEGVRATFFVVGIRLRTAPDLGRREVREGHLVENHTFSHLALRGATPAAVHAQIVRGAATIVTYLGVQPRWFRAPGGGVTPVTRAEADALGERTIRWTVDPKDWSKPSAPSIVARVLGKVTPGAVVLLHDGGGDRSQTVEALPSIIAGLKAAGYRFVTLDDL